MATKDKVLNLLIKNMNSGETNSVSGEKLAAECGVSRAAIWKAVNALRSEGIAIEGTTNGGYILCDNDIFTTEVFRQTLKNDFPDFIESHVEIFKEIDSTNTYAKRVLSECGNLRNSDGNLTTAGKKYHRAIIAAESQTAGRGRLGRTFVSPAKTGIYLSIIYAPSGGITNPAKITAFSAVAVCRAIKELYGISCQIKWINDIYAHGKKICGILTEGFTNFETGTIESAIIGIGINIRDNPEVFPKEVAKVAGSIEGKSDNKQHDSSTVSRAQLAAHVAANLLNILEETQISTEQNNDSEQKSSDAKNIQSSKAAAIMQEYKAASFLIGKTLTVHPIIGNSQSDYTAKAIDIDENAALVVELLDGSKKTLSSGEVSIGSSEFVEKTGADS